MKNLYIIVLIFLYVTKINAQPISHKFIDVSDDLRLTGYESVTNSDDMVLNGNYGASGNIIFQRFNNSDNSILWVKRILNSNSSWSNTNSLTRKSENCFALTGNYLSDLFFLTFDANGNVINAKRYESPDYDLNTIGESILAISDGYLISGRSNSFSSGTYKAFYTKVDNTGNIQWSKYFSTGNFYYAMQCNNGDYVLIGQYGIYLFVVRTDASGNKIWAKTYNGAGLRGIKAFESENRLIIFGEISVSSKTMFTSIMLDSNGNLLFAKRIGNTNDQTYAFNITKTENNNYVVAGSNYGSGSSIDNRPSPFSIYMNSADLSIIKTRRYSYYPYNSFATSFKELDVDRNILIGSTLAKELLILTDKDGNSCKAMNKAFNIVDITSSVITSVINESPLDVIFVEKTFDINDIVDVTATFELGCVCDLSITVAASDITCNGNNDGSIDLTVSGGTAPYTFQWDDAGNSTTEDLTGLSAGTYTVTVTEANGCIATTTVTISEPAAITLSITNSLPGSSGNDGAIDLSVTGGTAPYSYLWSNGETTEDITSLDYGSYAVTVTDANGCTSTQQIELQNNDIRIVYTIETCTGDCDGTAWVRMLAGTAPYTYAWSNGQTDYEATGLCEGTYSVTVTDAIGVTYTRDVTINSSFPVIGNEPPLYNITGNETWEGKIYYAKQQIVIQPGASLTIENTNLFIINYSPITTEWGGAIYVNKGATLIIDNSAIDGYIYQGTHLNGPVNCNRTWQGIHIDGDENIAPPADPYVDAHPNHGFLHITNHSKLLYPGYISAFWGGTMWMNGNSEISNNIYGLVDVSCSADFISTSKFNNCSFINNLPFDGWGGTGVMLRDINGLVIDNVTFKRPYYSPYDSYGTGIWFYSAFMNNSVEIKNCHFKNIERGINFTRSINADIHDNVFENCYKGVTLSENFDNVKISNNQFSVKKPVIHLFSDANYNLPSNDSYGIFAQYSNNLEISDNKFEGESSDDPDNMLSYGIVVDNNADGSANIFKNTFKGTDIGLQTQGLNPNLNIRCNNFNSNVDGSEGENHNVAAWATFGTLMQQGTDYCDFDDKYAAGNEWKNLCSGSSEIDIKLDDEAISFLYYAHLRDQNNQLTVKPLCSTTSWEQNYLYNCTEPKTATSCNSENPNYFSTPDDPQLNIEMLRLSTLVSNSTSIIESGDKQEIVDMVTSDAPAGNLKNAIIAVSPFASDRVLLSALNEKPTAMPAGHVKEIITANSPVTSTVMTAVNNLGLPNGIKKQIDDAQVGISEREKLERQIDYYKAQLRQIENFKINYYLANGNTAEAINLLNTSDKYSDKKRLAEIYFSTGNVDMCSQSLLDVLSNAGNYADDAYDYYELYSLFIELANQGKNIYDLSNTQEQLIRNIASGTTQTAYMARSILEVVFHEPVVFPIQKFGNTTRNLTITNTVSGINNQNSASKMFEIYPNPNNGKMYLDYELSTEGKLSIFDKTGRKVAEYKLDNGKNKLTINNLKLNSGVYTYSITTQSEIIKEGKLVIIE